MQFVMHLAKIGCKQNAKASKINAFIKMEWTPLPAPITQEATGRWLFCVIRRGGKRTHEKVVRLQAKAGEKQKTSKCFLLTTGEGCF